LRSVIKLAFLCLLSLDVQADANLAKKFEQKCTSSFELIRKNQPHVFLKGLPNELSEAERKKAISYVNKRHKKYIQKGNGWSLLEYAKGVEVDADHRYVELFNASKTYRAYFNMTQKNKKQTKRYVHCDFAKVNGEWYLVKLP